MTEWKFTNDYDIVACAFTLLLPWFQQDDEHFAAHCIWWLASIIRYMEILKFHLEYNAYPSAYIKDCIVTPLLSQVDNGTTVPESDIPALDLDLNSDTEEPIIPEAIRSSQPNNKQKQLNTTRSGIVFKNKPQYWEPTLPELEQCFGKQSKNPRSCTKDRVRAEYENKCN